MRTSRSTRSSLVDAALTETTQAEHRCVTQRYTHLIIKKSSCQNNKIVVPIVRYSQLRLHMHSAQVCCYAHAQYTYRNYPAYAQYTYRNYPAHAQYTYRNYPAHAQYTYRNYPAHAQYIYRIQGTVRPTGAFISLYYFTPSFRTIVQHRVSSTNITQILRAIDSDCTL
jgi:hypothetical protein